MHRRTLLFMTILVAVKSCPDDIRCRRCCNISQNQCSLCFDSLKNEDGKCEKEIALLPDCEEYDVRDSHVSCKRCRWGFFLNTDSLCEPCHIENCAVCDLSGYFCKACFGSNIFFGRECIPGSLIDPNCAIEIKFPESECVLCREYYALNSRGQCQPSTRYCERLDNTDAFCIQCLEGTHLTSEHTCVGQPRIPMEFKRKGKEVMIIFIGIIAIIFASFIFSLSRKKIPDHSLGEYRSVCS